MTTLTFEAGGTLLDAKESKQVAIVTGASSGIGYALSVELARLGYAVGVMARRKAELDTLVRRIESGGGAAAAAVADVGDMQSVRSAVDVIESTLGPCSLMIANAGVGMPTRLDPANLADIEQMFRINTLGVVYAFEAVMHGMLMRKHGHLAAVSSLAAYKGLPGESAYSASKAAVNTYLEGLRIQLRSRGIVVSTICPGFVTTPMTAHNDFKMPWVMSADQAARVIARALWKKRGVINFPWQTTVLMKLTRYLPDWFIARVLSRYTENPPFPPSSS